MAMGDSYKEEFTSEELAALGREPEGGAETETTEETAGTGETQETTEQTQETKTEQEMASTTETVETETEQEEAKSGTQKSDEERAAEEMGLKVVVENGKKYLIDDDGAKITEARWKSMYWAYKEKDRSEQSTKEKFDLFRKLGADEYYRVFPNEAPEGWKPSTEQANASRTAEVDPLKLVFTAKDQNHPYNGMTLGEIKEQDPFFATVLYNDWRDQQREKILLSRQENERTRQQEETQANAFGMARAKELFGIDDPAKITPEHSKAILALGEQVIKWQTENNCLHYTWEHAYKLMKHDELIAKAKEEGAKGTIKNLAERKSPASINTGGGAPSKDNSYAAMEKWTDAQIMKHIDDLSDAEYVKFKKEAPVKLLERIGL